MLQLQPFQPHFLSRPLTKQGNAKQLPWTWRNPLFLPNKMTEMCSCPPHRNFMAYDTSVALPDMFFLPTGTSHLEKSFRKSTRSHSLLMPPETSVSLTKNPSFCRNWKCLMIIQMFCCLSPQLIQCSHSVPILLLMPVAFLKCEIILRVKLHILLAAVQDDRQWWLFSNLHVQHKHFRLY